MNFLDFFSGKPGFKLCILHLPCHSPTSWTKPKTKSCKQLRSCGNCRLFITHLVAKFNQEKEIIWVLKTFRLFVQFLFLSLWKVFLLFMLQHSRNFAAFIFSLKAPLNHCYNYLPWSKVYLMVCDTTRIKTRMMIWKHENANMNNKIWKYNF